MLVSVCMTLSASAYVSARTFVHSSLTKHKLSNFSQQFKLESYTTTTTCTTSTRPAASPHTPCHQRHLSTQMSNSSLLCQIPESVVPEAYREWEVIFDWQTQCPTLAHDDDTFFFMYKFIQLLPTVGCEDAAATRYSIDERSISDANISAFAYQSTGCYVAVWSNNNNTDRCFSLELEHCLIDPRDKKSRVRIVQVVRLQDSKLVLQNIKVFCEHWYGPFRNGEQLGGCAIRDSAFASTQALDPTQVIGVWEGKHAISSFDNAPEKLFKNLSMAAP